MKGIASGNAAQTTVSRSLLAASVKVGSFRVCAGEGESAMDTV